MVPRKRLVPGPRRDSGSAIVRAPLAQLQWYHHIAHMPCSRIWSF
jgi:hypothetical protein